MQARAADSAAAADTEAAEAAVLLLLPKLHNLLELPLAFRLASAYRSQGLIAALARCAVLASPLATQTRACLLLRWLTRSQCPV